MADTHAGTCFCGAVAIAATGAPAEMGYCHCASCRRPPADLAHGFLRTR
jgi:hypothetical protein